MAAKYWGEIVVNKSNETVPDVTAEIEKSMDNNCLSEYAEESDEERLEDFKLGPLDPFITYAVSLHKYAGNLKRLIEEAENNTDQNFVAPAAPPLPESPDIRIKHKPVCLNFIPKDSTLLDKCESNVPELNEMIVKKLSTKCIAVMFAHIGFTTTHQSVLDLMTDVFDSFMQKFCGKIANAVEDGDSTKFTDIMEGVLIDMGIGGAKDLHDYYQNRVVNYADVLRKRCQTLHDKYSSISSPVGRSSVKFENVVRVKVEGDADTKEADSLNYHCVTFDSNPSVLETGLQLLQHLEAGEDLETA